MLNLFFIKPFPLFPRGPRGPRGSFCSTAGWSLFTDRRQALIIAAQLMKIVGINFDHMHMGDLLRMAHEHPRAEIVGVCDEAPERMRTAAANFSIPPDRVFTDYRQCLERAKPDIAHRSPATDR